MKKRIITGIIMAFILVPCVLLRQCLPVLEFIVVLLCIGGEIEMLNMYDHEKKIPLWLKVVSVILTLGLSFSIFSFMSESFGEEKSIILGALYKLHLGDLVTPVTALLLMFILLVSFLVFVKDFNVADAGKLFLSIVYVGVCTGAFITLRFFGVRFVIYLLAITICTDIFALVFGMTIGKKVFGGKHKMAPEISPNKTWEGGIGGTCVAVIVGFIFSYCYVYFSKDITIAGGGKSIYFFDGVFGYADFSEFGKVCVCIFLTLFLSICSQVGDLVSSKLKRAYGIKDYSQIFPGHGGVLDRFDSIFFASAMFLLFVICEQNLFEYIAEQITGALNGFGV